MTLRALLALMFAVSVAHAEPAVVRIATAAPEGSGWARELKAVTRELNASSNGELSLKWYFGSIAGTELEVQDRIRRGQLDGIASGGMLCMKLAPTMRIARIPGLFNSRDEVMHVLNRLHPEIDAEFRQHGFVNLGWSGFGFDAVFSRKPITSMADLRSGKFWLWSLDPVWQAVAREMGISFVTSEPNDAAQAYREQGLAGMVANPSVALVFQWSTEARYFTPLHAAFLPVCVLVSNSAFDALATDQKDALRAASAKMLARVSDVSESTERQLLGGLLERQGLRPVRLSPEFERAFLDEARRAREALGDKLVPTALLHRVNGYLAELRATKRPR
ncbi:MAG: TRAP transporter substrate-binding protein DctP [Actinomycetota bacterium]